MTFNFTRTALGLMVGTLCAMALGQELTVVPDKPSGLYRTGEPIVWKVQVSGDAAAEITRIDYVLKRNGMGEIDRGTLPVQDGQAKLQTPADAPGAILGEFNAARSTEKRLVVLAGALVEPEKIQPSAPRPDDFDAFWDAKLRAVSAIAPNAVLEKVSSGLDGIDYWKVTLDNINGTKVRGQIARPAAEGKYPAVLVVQWAGVYPLQQSWVTDHAKNGWLAMNILAHDLPIDEPPAFYEQQSREALRHYPAIGNDDREKSYFLRMLLGCYQAAEYLSSREDFNGELVVVGNSQGGMQALATAALHPKVTAALANVPAGCDHTAPAIGRQPAWPRWWHAVNGKDADQVRQTSRYFDLVNFAGRVKCPVLIGVGMIDTTCPPTSVYAAYNQLTGPKEILPLVGAGHKSQNNSHAPYYKRFGQWMSALKAGQDVPAP